MSNVDMSLRIFIHHDRGAVFILTIKFTITMIRAMLLLFVLFWCQNKICLYVFILGFI